MIIQSLMTQIDNPNILDELLVYEIKS